MERIPGYELTQLYVDQYMLVYSAVKHKDNEDLRRRIVFGQISAPQLVEMGVDDLETPAMQVLRDKARESVMASIDLRRFIQNTGIRCRRCKRETVVRTEKQDRSADEATSLIYTCSNCGCTWRVN